jgi:hypothetical protein
MTMRKGPIIGVALVVAAAVVLFAGVPVSRLLPWMMLFMHRGGHGQHQAHGAAHTESRDDLPVTKQ